MIWGYYDESGEYNAAGSLLNMTVGGCVSTLDKFRLLDAQWRKALADEGLPPCFHMADFEAWVPPFDFALPDGSRDHAKHKRLLNGLLDTMLAHVECFYGFAALTRPVDRSRAHKEYLEDCLLGVVSHATRETWDHYRQPINLVFAKQQHYPELKIENAIRFYDMDAEANRRIKGYAFYPAADVCALQAADILAYEMGRFQRDGRNTRYPFQRMMDAAKAQQIQLTIKWGPIRSRA